MTAKSISKIQCFEQCKAKYKLTYIDNVPLTEQDHLSRGKIIHGILENFNDFEVVHNFMNSDIGKKYYNIIKNAEREVKVGLKVADKHLVSCDFFDPNCIFHGVIDIVNGNVLCDYKTGKAKTQEEQDWSQLEAYALWAFINNDYDEVHVSYLYIEHNTENARTIKRSEINGIAKNILTRISNVIKYDDAPYMEYTQSALCDYCPCNQYCERYKLNHEYLKTLQVKNGF